ncbi:MAG: FtsX-like permease family protein [Ruminococcus sp.]|nr:FtsX-like permease family protein [Ruminococcus sp.]
MLFKLSLSNIRKSLRDYAIYFFTLIIGVSVFYVFNAVSGQVAMTVIDTDGREIARILQMGISAMSVFVAGVLGFLIVYASRFLMKRRNSEFALYLLLGMSKGKISAILLLETVIIGLGSLGVGLLLGIGLSQIMSALVVSLFEADMTRYSFMVSGEAVIKTILYFAVMYFVVMIFNSIVITRFKLIDLMHSGKKSEQIKLKKPWLCIIIFLLAAAALGYAYYQVGWNKSEVTGKEMALYIAMGAVSTFLIFWSVSGMLLRVVMSMKNVYFRSLNAFTFRQISSKVNTMVFSMTIICLMLFVTICTLTASFSMRNSMNANLEELCPVDFELSTRLEKPVDDLDIVNECKDKGLDMMAYAGEYTRFYTYGDADFSLEDFCGDEAERIKKAFVFLDYTSSEQLVGLSDYNALMELYGRDKLTMNNDEYILLCDYKSMKAIRDSVLENNRDINVYGQTLHSKYNECQDGFISLSVQHLNSGIFVVPDRVLDGQSPSGDYLIGNYKAADKEGKKETEKAVRREYNGITRDMSGLSVHKAGGYFGLSTKIDQKSGAVGLGAIATFMGLYIGLVFLIACGAILALKELSESVDSISRYEMLRKIGADESDISKSLFRQTGIFFMLPLILACVHSVFGMKFASFFLEIFGTEKMAESITATSVIILLIYGGYFLITYFCSKGIIKDRHE